MQGLSGDTWGVTVISTISGIEFEGINGGYGAIQGCVTSGLVLVESI